MNLSFLEFLLHSFSFAAVAFIASTFFMNVEVAADDIRKRTSVIKDPRLTDLYLGLSPESFLLFRVCFAFLFFVLGTALFALPVGGVLALFGFIAPALVLGQLRKRRVKRIEEQLIEGLELLGNGLKSGLTMQQSMELIVSEFPPPISQEFAIALAETRLGIEFTEALQRMAERLESNILHILSSGVSISKQCGGDVTTLFSNIATTIREQNNVEGKLDAVTAQGRFQGLILGMMPFALVVILYFIDQAHVETLFSETIGVAAFGGVIVMVIVAQLWIRKLLAIDV